MEKERGKLSGRQLSDRMLKRAIQTGMDRDQRIQQIHRRTFRVAAVLIAIVLIHILYAYRMKDRFYHFASLNGYEITGMNADEVTDVFAEAGDSTFVKLWEGDRIELMATLTDLGYAVDETRLRDELEELIQSQRKIFPWNLLSGKKYELPIPVRLDEAKLKEVIAADNLSTPRVKARNATLEQGEDGFYIRAEEYGTEFEDEALQKVVKDALSAVEPDISGTFLDVEVPEDIYKLPEITTDSMELNSLMDLYNRYANAKITYLFGNESETVDWATVEGWIRTKNGKAELDEEAIYHFLYEFAARHNTIYEPRTLVTTSGRTVTLDNNEYGYQVDLDGEYFQILEDLEKNTAIAREPVYAIAGYSRNGNNDLNGNYIEVDLTMQHLWMYKEGGLVLETDVVTGTPTQERETVQGAYAIPYKASPFNLIGQGGGGASSWDVEVEYWMPFCDGQGLHDASWRSSFGGNIYQTYGSHGCVNLPEYAAAVIYANVGTNMPIVLYK